MTILYLYATMVVYIFLHVQAAQNRFMLEIYNITCERFTNDMKLYECDFVKVAHGRYLINARMVYKGKLSNETNVRIRLSVKPRNGKKIINFLDVQVSLCMVTSQSFNSLFLRQITNEFIRTSNYPLNCMYKANYMYKVENFSLTNDVIPNYAPCLTGIFSIELSQNSKKISEYYFKGAIVPRKYD